MLQLIPATAGDRALLFNINQKYLYEMTTFYDDPMDEAGNYHYGHFDEYFTDPARTALLIRVDGRLAGFAMLYPQAKLTLIFPPITLNAKWWVIIFICIELFTGISGRGVGVAHFAHLGGALFGWLLIRYWKKTGKLYRSW